MSHFKKIIFLISYIIFSQNIYAQSEKKIDSEVVCGDLISSSFVLIPAQKQMKLEFAFHKNEEFCDEGRNEVNANFKITLRNKKGLTVYTKLFYINPMSFLEGTSTKEPNKFSQTSIKFDPTYRNLKFPLNKNFGEFAQYSVETYPAGVLYGKGVFVTKARK